MQDLIITNQGQELIAKMIAGTSTASFTKIQTSDYDYSTETLKDLTFLYDVKQEALISSVTRTDTTMVEVIGAIDNSELTAGYYVKALGLFASDIDGNEILYAVCIETENPDYMPAFGGKTVSGITYKLNTKVDISSQVTLEISPAAVPTMEQVNNLSVSVRTHTETNIYGESGVHGMRYFNEELQVQNEAGKWVDIFSTMRDDIQATNAIATEAQTAAQTAQAAASAASSAATPTAFSVDAAAWTALASPVLSGRSFSAEIAAEGVTVADIPDMYFDDATYLTAECAGIIPGTNDGKIVLYAMQIPDGTVSGSYFIKKGAT